MTAAFPHPPAISFIIPVWRDDETARDLLSESLTATPGVDWIVAAVDPGPHLRELAERNRIRLVPCPRPSRGGQMNAGAAVATGELLCFHHADTALTPAHLSALLAIAAQPGVIGGAFHRRFDDRHPWMQRWERWIHRFDHGFGPFFGDQSIFVRREAFLRLSGFADIPLMEDLEFSRRLKKAGTVRLLHPPIWSSPRRFRHLGNWRSSLVNALMIAMFYVGVSPSRLHRWYYASKTASDKPQTANAPQHSPQRSQLRSGAE